MLPKCLDGLEYNLSGTAKKKVIGLTPMLVGGTVYNEQVNWYEATSAFPGKHHITGGTFVIQKYGIVVTSPYDPDGWITFNNMGHFIVHYTLLSKHSAAAQMAALQVAVMDFTEENWYKIEIDKALKDHDEDYFRRLINSTLSNGMSVATLYK